MNQIFRIRKAFMLACALTTSAAAIVLGAKRNDDPPPDPCTNLDCVQRLHNTRPIQVPASSAGTTQVISRVHKPAGPGQAYVWKTEGYVPYAAGPLAPAGQPPTISQAWWPWADDSNQPGIPWTGAYVLPAAGVRSNLSLHAAPSPGDFLSPASTIGESSVALVPPGTSGLATWWQGASRPTLERSVDLVTGVPLAEFTDVVLPVDGAEFRLKRTRSSETSLGDMYRYGFVGRGMNREEWWDWSGLGWMSSENPVLLIDSSLPDVTGDGPKTTYLWLDAHHSIPFQQVFHPDTANPGDGRIEYEAPPRFRARLKHNGIARFPSSAGTSWESKIDPDNQIGWKVPPSQFEIWLYDGAIKYTFVAMYDLVPRNDSEGRVDAKGAMPPTRFNKNYLQNPAGPANWMWLDYNARPFTRQQFVKALQGDSGAQNDPRLTHNNWDINGSQPGHGLPHHGICVRIESPHGHSVEITHASVKRTNYNVGFCGIVTSPEDGLSRGAVRHIKIKNGADVRWTLLYTYRRFRGISSQHVPGRETGAFANETWTPSCGNVIDMQVVNPEEANKRLYQSAGHMCIDRIYVFEGDVSDALLDDFSADIEHPAPAEAAVANQTAMLNQLPQALLPGEQDPIDLMIQSRSMGGSKGWTYKVRYHYKTEKFPYDPSSGIGVSLMPLLVQSTVTTRAHEISPSGSTNAYRETQRRTIFAYSHVSQALYGPTGRVHTWQHGIRWAWLRAIFTEEDISNAIKHCATKVADTSFLRGLNEQEFREWARPVGQQAGQTIANWTAIGGGDEEMLLRFASKRWGTISGSDWPSDGVENPQTPTLSALRDSRYMRTDAQGFYNHNIEGGTASVLQVRSGQSERVYRINRLLVIPNGVQTDVPRKLDWIDGLGPHRSLFSHPYMWQASMDAFVVPSTFFAIGGGSAPDLTKARWITIIDEMPAVSFDANGNIVYDEAFENYNSNGVKRGQISRRVVEMNAAGYVLRDRRWDFASDSAGQTVVSGGGLGEQYVYVKAEKLGIQGLPTEPIDPQGGGAAPELIEKTNAVRMLRNEVMLVEKRSVGWSAAEMSSTASNPNPSLSSGLVHFFEYRFVPDDKRAAGGFLEVHGRGIQSGAQELNGVPQPVSSRMFAGKSIELVNPTQGIEIDVAAEFIRPVYRSEFERFCFSSTDQDLTLAMLDGWANDGHKVVATVTTRRRLQSSDRADANWREQRVRHRLVIGAPRKLVPGGTWYYPVEKEWYDDKGNSTWSASGLVRNPFNPIEGEGGSQGGDPFGSLVFTYIERVQGGPGSGSSKHTVVDAAPGTYLSMVKVSDPSAPVGFTGEPVVVPNWPESLWQRMPANGAGGTSGGSSSSASPFYTSPRNAITSFQYDADGLTDVYYPNGRRWARRTIGVPRDAVNARLRTSGGAVGSWDVLPADESSALSLNGEIPDLKPTFGRVYIFDQLRPIAPYSSVCEAEAVCEVIDYREPSMTGAPELKRRVKVVGQFDLDGFNDVPDQPQIERLTLTKLGVDSFGRIQKADLLEWIGGLWALVGQKEVNDLGEVYRELDMMGNRTRITRNALGQNLRKYVGTSDSDWVTPPTTVPAPNYNMVLVERTEYGTGVHDAWMPTVTRTYRNNPVWATQHYGTPPTSDADGTATVTSYDWRMRAVRVDRHDEGVPTSANRASTTLTYLDHADRVRLTVTIGRGTLNLGAAKDPASMAVDELDGWPATGELSRGLVRNALSITPRPSSVVEMVYGPDGGATETRTYDVAWNASASVGNPPYQAHYSYRGRGGEDLIVQRPGSPTEYSVIDGLGRVVSSVSAVNFAVNGGTITRKELARTDFTHDLDGNVVETARWERVIDTGDVLNLTNAVRSRTITWYDRQKRVVATADLGTEQAAGFVAGSPNAGVSWQTAAPTIAQPGDIALLVPGAVVMIYEYDQQGNQVKHRLPNGSVTESKYSSMNRLIERIENSTDPVMKRRTRYTYDIGRVATIEAERTPGVSASAPAVFQKTEVLYGADVLTSSGIGESQQYQDIAVSRNHALIGLVRMPGEVDGAPDTRYTSDYVLRYTFGGQVAERVDGRGLAMRYYYTSQGLLDSIEVGHYSKVVIVNTDPLPVEFREDRLPFILGAFTPGYARTHALESIGLPQRAAYVRYEYDSQGRLSEIKTYDRRETPRQLISHVRSTYDERGNLVSDQQGLWTELAPANVVQTPRLGYLWTYVPTDVSNLPNSVFATPGTTRLDAIQYGEHNNANAIGREVKFAYGASGSLDDRLSRISRIETRYNNSSVFKLSGYEYTGERRRVTTNLGIDFGGVGAHAITQSVKASSGSGVVGLSGLDSMGRLRDLTYTNNAYSGGINAILYQALYGFDTSGNRTSADVTQAPTALHNGDLRSQRHTYDLLDRLIESRIGRVEDGNIVADETRRREVWQMDLQGNWTGRLPGVPAVAGASALPAVHGRALLDDKNHVTDATTIGVDEQNKIRTIVRESANGASEFVPIYDRAGNLICDGTLVYQYDAWCRLVEVRKAVREDYWPFYIPAISSYVVPGTNGNPPVTYYVFSWDPEGYYYPELGAEWAVERDFVLAEENVVLDEVTGLVSAYFKIGNRVSAGALVKRFIYDGRGRLASTETYNDPAAPGAGGLSLRRVVDEFTYDGIRRVREVRTVQAFNESTNAWVVETPTKLLREYVWGPGDGHAGVDELIAQFGGATDVTDETKPNARWRPWFILQDGGGDIVAVVDSGLVPQTSLGGGGGSSQPASVAAQFVYNAYGEVIAAEHLSPHPLLHAGHKGLFFDRLDGDTSAGQVGEVINWSTGDELPTLVANASGGAGLYQMRNRVYSPTLGRFMQRDPNATSMVLIESASMHGKGLGAAVAAISPDAMYGDGHNLYQYLGSNPWQKFDPTGLRWDPFDEAFAIGAEHLWSGLVSVNQALFHAKEGIRAARAYERAAFQWSELVMDRDEAILIGMVVGPFFSTICFESGTPVAIPDGSLQKIESLPLGAIVASAHHNASDRTVVSSPNPDDHETIDPAMWRRIDLQLADTHRGAIRVSLLRHLDWLNATGLHEGDMFAIHMDELGVSGHARVLSIGPCPDINKAPPGSGVVTGTFVTERAEILQVWLYGASEPIGATTEHPFYSDDRSAWVPAGELRAGEAVRTLSGPVPIDRIDRPGRQTTVYNLEIHRSHTYYVGDSRAWVHNTCSPNQANKLIRDGKAPSDIWRVDIGKIPHELTHLHFHSGPALNNNGTWKHGSKVLTNAEKRFITEVLGWPLP